jgi:hypothetical protein
MTNRVLRSHLRAGSSLQIRRAQIIRCPSHRSRTTRKSYGKVPAVFNGLNHTPQIGFPVPPPGRVSIELVRRASSRRLTA